MARWRQLGAFVAGLATVAGLAGAVYVPDFAAPGYLARERAAARPELRRLVRELRSPAGERYLFGQNPEWSLMAHTFLVYALAGAAREDPGFVPEARAAIDELLARLLARPAEAYLLPYHRVGPWRVARGPEESAFYLGEVSLALGMRRELGDTPALRARHRALLERLAAVLTRSPHGYAESYPDECWSFCNAIALASLAVGDRLDGGDHGAQFRRWEAAMRSLSDARTGLVPSAYTTEGRVVQGPEGSSAWVVVAFASVVAPRLARDQYARATRWLGGNALGFTYGREWPWGVEGAHDIDSGLTVLGVGPASTGFSLAAARVVGDAERYGRTRALLDLVAVPVTERDGARHYLPSNVMGDVVFAFGAVGIR